MKKLIGFLGFILMLAGCGRFEHQSADSSLDAPEVIQVYSATEVLDLSEMENSQNKNSPSEAETQDPSKVTPQDKQNTNTEKKEEEPKSSASSNDSIQIPVMTPPPQKKPSEPTPAKPTEKFETPKTETTSQLKPFNGAGTVYYIPQLSLERKCKTDDIIPMRTPNGKELVKLCRSEIAECSMQGSCLYISGKEPVLFAYSRKVAVQIRETNKIIKEPRFKINPDLMKCPQGMGFRNICLDPNRSIAADMKFHKAGDVVYVPKVAGQKMPNGEIHDGYFIVRDIGEKIVGEGRFDFFIGFANFRTHVFTKLGLSDEDVRFVYYKVDEKTAEQVRQARAYPSAPTSVSQSALAQIETLGLAKGFHWQ